MKKILLLDDNLDIIQIVEEVLSYEQYEVKSITKSIDFLADVEHFRPELIILDYKLADGHGGELCRAIKAHAQFHHISVMIFTAYMEPGLDLFIYGCDEVIAKPFDLDSFLSAVRSLTGNDLQTA